MNKIDCPFCGLRDAEEFQYEGDATKRRPVDDDPEAWFDFTYLRDNPDSWHHELWYHGTGCRRYLTVERHMTSHEIRSVRLTQENTP